MPAHNDEDRCGSAASFAYNRGEIDDDIFASYNFVGIKPLNKEKTSLPNDEQQPGSRVST